LNTEKKEDYEMKTWMKYLVIGWSIASVGIIIVSFQLIKSNVIKEHHTITMVYKTPEKPAAIDKVPIGWEVIAEELFHEKDVFDRLSVLDPTITKLEFVDKIKKAKGLTIESKRNITDNSIYIFFPIYSFFVWGLPILVFSLIGVIFGREKKTP
jgi:hypothetical protein